MTILDAIQEADRLKPNSFPTEQKLRWLERLERRIREELLSSCEGSLPDWEAFDSGELDRKLLVDQPYDELYVHWLCAQMDYYEREYQGFNASNAMFEAVYGRFRNNWNARHRPRGTRKSYNGGGGACTIRS